MRWLRRIGPLLAASIVIASTAPRAWGAADDAVGRLTPDVLPALGPSARWAVRMPAGGKLVYRGVVNFDHAGSGPGFMMYPGFGLAGFFAALATHGALLQSAQNSEKTKIQEHADAVLLPYREVLADFDGHQLVQAALERSRLPGHGQWQAGDSAAEPRPDWLIDVAPAFAMTQDQSALVLDTIVVVHSGGDAGNAVYRNLVRVVSRPRDESDLPAYWTADHGAPLKAESAALLAQSIDLAMQDMSRSASADLPQRTVRYAEGHVARMERAQLLEDACSRRLLRTLRGWLMSVPASDGACPGAEVPESAASASSAP